MKSVSSTPSRQRLVAQPLGKRPAILHGLIGLALSVAAIVGLLLWELLHGPVVAPQAPVGASALLFAVTGMVALAMHTVRERFASRGETTDTLPDPLYALYLATIILIGMPPAVLLALVTPLIEDVLDVMRQPGMVSAALRRSAVAGIVTFVSGLTYIGVGQALRRSLSALHAHTVAAVAAALIMLVCIGVARALETETIGEQRGVVAELARFCTSPALRFQLLLLSIGPLLPLAEALDDVEAEFAWILFLVPLGAVYYLALLSARLQQRTDELQSTVSQLGASRRRQAELSDYAALITRAQEDERRRLARELHDDTAQALIALSRGLDALAFEREGTSGPSRYVADLSELAKRTLDGVRRACQDLRPSVLDDLGLPAALESLTNGIARLGLPCQFTLTGDAVTAAPEIEVTVYRIAQEALTNARKHAHATKTRLDIAYTDAGITLTITDDGAGFAYGQQIEADGASAGDVQSQQPRFGLVGMRERAALIHGTLNVHSTPDRGTTIRLYVPWQTAPRT